MLSHSLSVKPSRPILLDLFCGAGGAGVGYANAGFEVVGVDIAPQSSYPFRFIQADALRVLSDPHLTSYATAIHASPPCQAYSSTRNLHENVYPDLIPAVRQALAAIGKPYVIENVAGAPLFPDLMLCGEMFSLAVQRHRFFEVGGFVIDQPEHVPHRGSVQGWDHGKRNVGPYFPVYGSGGGKGTLEQWKAAMGTPWMRTRHEVAESIPPAYSQYIGSALLSGLLRG